MSLKVMSWVFYDSQAKGIDKLVLLAIADHAHDDGASAYPGMRLLAQKAGVSQATICRAVERLVKLGELEVTDRETSARTKASVGRGTKLSYRVRMGRNVSQRNVTQGNDGPDSSADDVQIVPLTIAPIEDEPSSITEPLKTPPTAARITARDLLAEHLDALGHDLATKGQLAATTKRLLERVGVPADELRMALAVMRERGLTSPNVLPALVDEVRGGGRRTQRPTRYALNGDHVTPPAQLQQWAARRRAEREQEQALPELEARP